MARFNYGKMQDTAARLLDRFQQGVVTYSTVEAGDPEVGAGPFDPPPPDVVKTYALDAVVRSVEDKYLERELIQATDDQITFPPFATHIETDDEPVTDGVRSPFEPVKGQIINIDGVPKTIVERERKPGAGTVIVWTVWARA